MGYKWLSFTFSLLCRSLSDFQIEDGRVLTARGRIFAVSKQMLQDEHVSKFFATRMLWSE